MTADDLDRLETTAPTSLSSGELTALIALARRALELESVLVFTENHLRPVRSLLPEDLIKDASAMGWSHTAKGEANGNG